MLAIFNDENGNVSSMNFVWIISLITIIGTWIALSIKLHGLQHVTPGDALWFATLFSGKVLQNFFETKYKINEDTTVKSGMLEDNQGRTSISRILWVIATLGIVFTWSYISLSSNELQHFTSGDAAWFAALFGSKIGGTVIEREFGIKDEDEERDRMFARYRGSSDNEKDSYGGMYRGAGDGDSDPDEGDISLLSGYGHGGDNSDRDELIKQLQETIRVQTQFNKNLVKKIDPSMKLLEDNSIEENKKENELKDPNIII